MQWLLSHEASQLTAVLSIRKPKQPRALWCSGEREEGPQRGPADLAVDTHDSWEGYQCARGSLMARPGDAIS